MIIDNARAPLSEKLIKELHFILKNGTSDSRKSWFAIGEYKKKPNGLSDIVDLFRFVFSHSLSQ